MKTVKALKSFSNSSFSMYAGEIRELSDSQANAYIAEGMVKEYFEPDDVNITPILTEGTDIATATINGEEVTIKAPAGGGGGSSDLFPIALTWNADWSIATLNKTFSEIKTALQTGLFPFVTSVDESGGSYLLDIYSLEQFYSDSERCSIVITIVDEGAQQLNVYYFNGMSLDSTPTYNSNA